MRCSTVRHWLLTSGSADALAKPLQRHLHTCERCRRQSRQLARLEACFKRETPPGCDAAMQAFLKSVPDLARTSMPAAPPPANRLGWIVPALLVAAVIVGALITLRLTS